jgi:DNA-binding beta-propeller fold protein YncE
MVLDAERNLIFASIEDRNEVVSISPGLQVVHRFKLNASQPTGLAFDPKAHRIYVAVRYAVLALNPDTGSELGRAFTPAGTDLLWLDSDSGTLFAAAGGGTITVIRTEGGSFQVVDEMHSEVRGHTLAFDPARKLVYMPGGREGRSKLLIVRSLAAPAQQPSSDQVALRK